MKRWFCFQTCVFGSNSQTLEDGSRSLRHRFDYNICPQISREEEEQFTGTYARILKICFKNNMFDNTVSYAIIELQQCQQITLLFAKTNYVSRQKRFRTYSVSYTVLNSNYNVSTGTLAWILISPIVLGCVLMSREESVDEILVIKTRKPRRNT